MKKIVSLAAIAMSCAGTAHAQQGSEWQFEATPYLWAAGMQGDVGVGRLEAGGVEMGFPDIAKNLRAGFMGSLDGRKGELGFFLDGVYMKIHQSHPASRPLFGDVDAKMTQQGYVLAATWRATGSNVDLFAGARANYIKADLDLSTSALAPQGRSVVKNRNWVDGIVGARGRAPLGDRWGFTWYGDVGAGGSDLTWQAMAGVDFAISKDTAVKAGYRYLKTEYDKADFLYDMASAGAYLGLGMRF